MKALTYLLLLIATSLFWGCSEEISEEIQSESSSSPATGGGGSPGTIIPEPGSIRVTNNASGSYIMHREGSLSDACELQAPVDGFVTEDYANNNPATAIDCVLDAEEFDLYFGGAQMQLEVDENLCEYIEYRPFKYLQWQPGFTARDLFQVECDDSCSAPECNRSYATMGGATLSSLNDEIQGSICVFDYSSETNALGVAGPNCDTGSATITTLTYSLNETTMLCELSASAPVVTSCGGELSACYAGAATTTNNLEIDEIGLLTDNPSLDSISQEITIDSPFQNDFNSNMHIASYSRVCSSTSNTKVNSDFDSALVSLLGNEVETIASANNFDPIRVDIEGDGETDYFTLAYTPFQGIATSLSPRNSVTPYYSIRCLDSARDIKAHIRVHIREWDRVIDPENVFITQISDVNQGVLARMDASGDQEPGNPWNDFLDWDDHFSDYDLNPTNDINPNDGAGFSDPIFVANQCRDINVGQCFDDSSDSYISALTNQTTCEGASSDNRWIPSRDAFPEFRQ